jgi:inosine-uridine nucleoside N-ribohydrolase
MLHAFESRGEAKILAVTVTKDNPAAPAFVDAMNVFYGRGYIPVGMVRNGKTPEASAMLDVPLAMKNADGSPVYPRRIADVREAPEAVALLTRVLAAQPDQSVVIIQVGFSTNLARLLATAEGRELARRKVRLLSLMGGAFPRANPEYNIKMDIPAAKTLFAEWPSPIVASGFEVGLSMLFPAASIEKEFGYVAHHPVVDSYRAYKKMPYDRPTWDPTAVLYAVRPERGYFSLSAPGRINVDESGHTPFTPDAAGRHRYLLVNEVQKARALEAMINLTSEPGRARFGF